MAGVWYQWGKQQTQEGRRVSVKKALKVAEIWHRVEQEELLSIVGREMFEGGKGLSIGGQAIKPSSEMMESSA